MDRTLSHLEFLRSITNSTTNFFHEKDLSIKEFIPVGFIERTYQSVIAIEILWKNISQNKALEYAIGIILRPQLLDGLTVANLHRMVQEKAEENAILLYLRKILSDGFKHTVRYLDIKRQNEHITDEELTLTHKNLYDLFSWCLKEYEPSVKPPALQNEFNKNFITADNLLTELSKSKDHAVMRDFHEFYAVYSKYDHFGLFYFLTMKQDIEESIERIRFIIYRLLFHCYFIHAVLYYINGSKNDFILNQMKKMNAYLDKNKDQYIK